MPAAPDKILIVRTSALGDIVRTVPALVSLRRAYPQARIDWLITDTFMPAIENHPDLSAALPFPRRRLGDALRAGRWNEVRDWLGETLTRPAYDLVLDFQGLLRSGILTLATWSPRRVGFADARELGWLGYTQRVSIPGGRSAHHVERVFALLRGVGVEPVPDFRLYPAPADRAALLEDAELCGKRYLLISPTTRGLGRAWPIERFAEVAQHLLDHREGVGLDAVVCVGLASERDYCAPMLKLPNPGMVDRVGATGISGLMALVESSSLVLCSDSAVMHMAVAFDRPLVALFGPSDLGHAGPYGRGADAISHRHAGEQVRHRDVPRASAIMRRITAAEVIEAVRARLRQTQK